MIRVARALAGDVVAALALALATGCGGGGAPSPAPSASASAPPATASAFASAAPPRRTTPPAIALSNFQGQVRVIEDRFQRLPGDLTARATLVGVLLDRGQMLGRPADLARASTLGSEAASEKSYERVPLVELRASTFAAVHRFEEATSALAPALMPDRPVPAELLRIQASVHAARGELDRALGIVEPLARQRPGIGILGLQAKILGEMGRVDDATRVFDQAEAVYKNPAPFALADLHTERGVLAETQGDLTKAKEAYRAARERLPQHAHATLHLAPLLVPAEAVALLQALLVTCEDPEARAKLGEAKNLVEKGSGDADIAAAAVAYDALLQQLPEAYADHAAWFFLGAGKDPAKAWTWAQKNLAVRPNAGAFELAIAAATAASVAEEERCALVKRAREYQWPTPRLREVLAASRCP